MVIGEWSEAAKYLPCAGALHHLYIHLYNNNIVQL
jgi:hypothetical protein